MLLNLSDLSNESLQSQVVRQIQIHSRRRKGFFVSDLSLKRKMELAQMRFEESVRPLIQTAVDEGMERDQILEAVETALKESSSK